MSFDAIRDYFERVYVISLKRRVDRLGAFYARLEACGWPFKEPIVMPAIEGDVVGVPPEFTQGGGAYGCKMSHLRILQDCLMDGVSSVLVLEDDAEMPEDFVDRVKEFLSRVPENWEGLMLGGQHMVMPRSIGVDGVVQCVNAQRTHAYAARPYYMRELQKRWALGTVHIDWQMSGWQHNYVVYAPSPWIVGQVGGRSDIFGASKRNEWWNYLETGGYRHLPVCHVVAPVSVIRELGDHGLHFGYDTSNNLGIDNGLHEIFTRDLTESEIRKYLRLWLETVNAESQCGLLPAAWHPKLTLELLREVWSAGIIEVRGQTFDECWSCIPEPIRSKLERRRCLVKDPIILLRCPQRMIGDLARSGFHPGNWRDRTTGYDCGLIDIFKNVRQHDRLDHLRRWCNLLLEEAEKDGRVVAAIHPDLTRDMLESATDRIVYEIEADSLSLLVNKYLEIRREEGRKLRIK